VALCVHMIPAVVILLAQPPFVVLFCPRRLAAPRISGPLLLVRTVFLIKSSYGVRTCAWTGDREALLPVSARTYSFYALSANARGFCVSDRNPRAFCQIASAESTELTGMQPCATLLHTEEDSNE
jgi:hypothetical protein